MGDGFRAADLAGLPGMPGSVRNVQLRAKAEGWAFSEQRAQGGTARLYPLEALPEKTRAALTKRGLASTEQLTLGALGSEQGGAFARASEKARATATRRAKAVSTLRSLILQGHQRTDALALVAREQGESVRTLQRWDAAVRGKPEHEWAALLVPAYRATAELEAVHPDAWNHLLSDYLRPSRPAFASCYRRLGEVAAERGWSPLPSLWSLQRRLDKEVAPSILMLKREGLETYLRTLPSQRRDKSGLHALEWVNADGHKLDVFAAWPMAGGGVRVARPIVVAWHDVYSGKFLSWRIDETENADAVRLAFADMVRDFGIPERVTIDNGHAFAGKEMTGGLDNRHRFGPGDDSELTGLYRAFGIREVHFATPYHGQAKPIERAFRDLAEEISRHPDCAGAYTGNRVDAKPEDYGSRAIPIVELAAIVGREIARHNARTGRTSPVCQGRSFDETFETSIAGRVVRHATAAQIQWLMLPSKPLMVSRLESTITLLGNRYHDPALIDLRGQTVSVRYDPNDLQAGVHVFRDGDLERLCFAACIAPVGFGDTDAARRTARARSAQLKAAKAEAAALGTIPARELMSPPVPAKKKRTGNVVEGKFGRAAQPVDRPVAAVKTAPSEAERDFLLREFEAFERSAV